MLGAPYPVSVRLRSNSSPAHPRASIVPSTTPSEEQLPQPVAGHESPPPPDSRKLTSPRSKPKRPSLSNDVSEQQSPPSNPFRLFRLKRPSTSSGVPPPTISAGASSSQGGSISPKSPRAKGPRRPSTSSGVPEHQDLPRMSPTQGTFGRGSSPFRGLDQGTVGEGCPVFHQNDSESTLESRASSSKMSPPRLKSPPVADPQPSRVRRPSAAANMKQQTQDRPDTMLSPERCFKYKNKKRHHAYPQHDVPYPINYEHATMDSDIWEGIWMNDVRSDLTWHRLDPFPHKVLDLGCGSGSWIFECAAKWKETEFVGLDIVPLHPDLHALGCAQLAPRIAWVEHNFLKPLPFPDEEFDFIHARRISRGVPEDKWYTLLEELHRILKTGGSLEIYEEELSFPGKPVKPQGLEPMDLPGTYPTSPVRHSRDNSGQSDASSLGSASQHQQPHAHRLQAEQVSSRTIPGTMPEKSSAFTNRYSSMSPPTRAKSPQTLAYMSPLDVYHVPRASTGQREQSENAFAQAQMREPIDPRDHSFLELIYNEMYTSRFINLEPLALLRSALPLFFDDVCCHPPLIMTFPPPPKGPPIRTPGGALPDARRRGTTLPETIDEDAEPLKPDSTIVTSMALISGSNPYIKIDDTRLGGWYRRQTAESLAEVDKILRGESRKPVSEIDEEFASMLTSTHAMRKCRRPNDMARFDLRCLPLQLQLRVHEVLGCVEEMWGWVQEYQHAHAVRRDGARCVCQPFHEELLGMSRVEYDELVSRFELDMEEHMGMSYFVRDELAWPRGRPSRTQARKDFEQLCAEWTLHQHSKLAAAAEVVGSASDTLVPDQQSSTGRPRKKTGSLGSLESHPIMQGTSPSFLKPWERESRRTAAYCAWK